MIAVKCLSNLCSHQRAIFSTMPPGMRPISWWWSGKKSQMNSRRCRIRARPIRFTSGAIALAGIQAIATSKAARSKYSPATRAA